MSESISIPSLLLFAGLGFIVYRIFFSASPSANAGGGGGGGGGVGRGRGRRRNISVAAVEQVATMFPQLDRRAIVWNLQLNGGNPQATVERMLTAGDLEQPPPSFQLPDEVTPQMPTIGGAAGGSSSSSPANKSYPDLITKYNLAGMLNAKEATEQEAEAGAGAEAGADRAKATTTTTGWSTNKNERAALLQRRRDQMILQARRKMEERDRKGKAVDRG